MKLLILKFLFLLGRMWIPSYNALRMEFVDAILDGSKRFLRMDEVRAIKVPTSKYISVKALYPRF